MKPHEEWLFKAENDLSSADILLNSSKPLLDIAIYHTQQCAEKALKSFLAFNEKDIEKIHNLIILTGLCAELDHSFNSLKEDAIYLNPYSTLYRYPDGDLLPPEADVRKAIEAAERILSFVKNKIRS